MTIGKRRNRGGNHASSEDVAGNGLIHRRALLGRGIALAGAMTTGAGASLTSAAAEPLKNDPWTLEMGQPTPALQVPSRFEKNVVRTLTNPRVRTAIEEEGIRLRSYAHVPVAEVAP